MKRFSFWIIVSLFTFFIGICAVLAWLYYNQKEIVEVEPVQLLDNKCLQSKSFPGLSKIISDIQKGKDESLMKAIGEESLLDVTDKETEIYRFIWLRTFHHPIFVRVERNRNSIKLSSKEFDGKGGYGFGIPFREVNTTLDEGQWCNFLSLLEKSNFWKIPSEKRILVNDGANWILEGMKGGRYHIVDRNPPETYEYQEACVYLLKLSGFDTDRLKHELY